MVERDSPVLRDVVKTGDLLRARVRTGCSAANERVFKFEFCGVRNRRFRDPAFTRANQIYREQVEVRGASSAYGDHTDHTEFCDCGRAFCQRPAKRCTHAINGLAVAVHDADARRSGRASSYLLDRSKFLALLCHSDVLRELKTFTR